MPLHDSVVWLLCWCVLLMDMLLLGASTVLCNWVVSLAVSLVSYIMSRADAVGCAGCTF